MKTKNKLTFLEFPVIIKKLPETNKRFSIWCGGKEITLIDALNLITPAKGRRNKLNT